MIKATYVIETEQNVPPNAGVKEPYAICEVIAKGCAELYAEGAGNCNSETAKEIIVGKDVNDRLQICSEIGMTAYKYVKYNIPNATILMNAGDEYKDKIVFRAFVR